MSLPSQLYLRDREGRPVGPLPVRSVEVLYDARIVDESTPVSGDGSAYTVIGAWAELRDRIATVRSMLERGGNPWGAGVNASADGNDPLLRTMLRCAARRSTGTLVLERPTGGTRIRFRDGSIVGVDEEDAHHTIDAFLESEGLLTSASRHQALVDALDHGGDVGSALMAQGVIAPHVFLEKLGEWARKRLAHTLTEDFQRIYFESGTPHGAEQPLGLDRLGFGIELIRQAIDTQLLKQRMETLMGRTLIPSQVDGVPLSETKLHPRELRALNSVDGVKTVRELLDTFGEDESRRRSTMVAIYFALDVGFVVPGDDKKIRAEEAQIHELTEYFGKLKTLTFLKIFDIEDDDSDEEVRKKYKTLVKRYHPDTLKPGAAPALIKIRESIFALLTEAYEAVETTGKREKYLRRRRASSARFNAQKEDPLKMAETDFKKAEILFKTRQYDQAWETVQQAIEQAPQNAKYRVFAAYLAYHNSSDEDKQAAAKNAVGQINQLSAQAQNPNTYLYLGHLYRALGDQNKAHDCFEEVLKLEPANNEALSEVRVHRMREERKKKKRWLS